MILQHMPSHVITLFTSFPTTVPSFPRHQVFRDIFRRRVQHSYVLAPALCSSLPLALSSSPSLCFWPLAPLCSSLALALSSSPFLCLWPLAFLGHLLPLSQLMLNALYSSNRERGQSSSDAQKAHTYCYRWFTPLLDVYRANRALKGNTPTSPPPGSHSPPVPSIKPETKSARPPKNKPQ